MNFSPRINEAIKLACHLHRYQTRKDNLRTPYVSHLFGVAVLISSVTDDEDTIIGGLMHDSLEDVKGYTYKKLVEDCGQEVADIVTFVTEPLDANKPESDQLPWLERKQQYLENLKKGGLKSALISAADKIHNTESFLFDAKKEGEDFTNRFGSSLRNKVWFHEQVLEIVAEKIGEESALVVRLRLCTEEFRKLLRD